jgi:short-subunit dehydrogenase
MDYIVITGVSTGIGYDAVRYLIDKGYHVFKRRI